MSGATLSARVVVRRIGFYVFVGLVTAFFALPMLWLVTAPFSARPGFSVDWPDFTLANFTSLTENTDALPSLYNSAVLSLWTMAVTVTAAALAAYALSRVRIPGRDGLLYLLLLLSSVITGTAAMVPIFQLMFTLRLLDKDVGVILVLTGGLLPAAIFILKDFMDGMPRSYEESARVFGAGPLQVLGHVVLPNVRPGLATIAVWAVVQVWGNFLMPFLLYRSPEKQPAAVTLNTFYTQGGQPNLALISTFSLLYSIPVVIMFLFVSRRYGFRFHGGVKA
ncbi:MAG TPA: carbohydrate ABC transporter permease [Streptosporangiaceae bacterium]|jgi:multiple sugar transport system permease protein|nr:carbohydrate ABC transporter permease [Streptosporangiaceae bacterium]